MAVGLTRPVTLEEAQNIFRNVKTFSIEAKDIQLKIDEIGEMSKKIKCKTSVTDKIEPEIKMASSRNYNRAMVTENGEPCTILE